MPRFSYEDADKYGGSGSGRSYFSLKDDGDTAQIHLLGDDMKDFPGYAVHRVPIGDGFRYVNCLREAGQPVDVCPFCAEGKHSPDISKVWAKLFIPIYNIDADEVQIWERGKNFFRELAQYCAHTPHASEAITEVTRSGKKGDTSTTYRLYEMKEKDNFDIENVRDEIPEIIGTIVLDKTAEDMEYYLDHGSFDDNPSAGRSRASRSDDVPFEEDNRRGGRESNARRGEEPRRRPNRRTAEDEY